MPTVECLLSLGAITTIAIDFSDLCSCKNVQSFLTLYLYLVASQLVSFQALFPVSRDQSHASLGAAASAWKVRPLVKQLHSSSTPYATQLFACITIRNARSQTLCHHHHTLHPLTFHLSLSNTIFCAAHTAIGVYLDHHRLIEVILECPHITSLLTFLDNSKV